MPEHVRVAVIGASPYSERRHLAALKSHPRAELVAICDIDHDRAKQMAAKYGIPLVSSDYREVIDKGNVDALLVVTPHDTHHAITMDALDAGLHVLCEKPLALHAGQGDVRKGRGGGRQAHDVLYLSLAASLSVPEATD